MGHFTNVVKKRTPVDLTAMVTGTGDYLQSAEATTGMGSDWSISTWIRRVSAGVSGQRIFQLSPADLTTNRRELQVASSTLLILDVHGSPGSKVYFITDMHSAGASVEWDHIVFTYTDGGGGSDVLKVYVNGEDITDKSSGSGPGDPYVIKFIDGECNQTDTAQNITLGAGTDGNAATEWAGRMYNWGGWSSVLTAAEVTSLYNGGNGSVVDYRVGIGDYDSTGDLLFYWRFDNTGDRTENVGSDVTHDLDAESDPGTTYIADAPVG